MTLEKEFFEKRAPWEDTPEEKARQRKLDEEREKRIQGIELDNVYAEEDGGREKGGNLKSHTNDVIRSMQKEIDRIGGELEDLKRHLNIGVRGIPDKVKDDVIMAIMEEYDINKNDENYVGVPQSLLIEKLLARRDTENIRMRWQFGRSTTIKYLRLLAKDSGFNKTAKKERTGNKNEFRWVWII